MLLCFGKFVVASGNHLEVDDDFHFLLLGFLFEPRDEFLLYYKSLKPNGSYSLSVS